jgi:hypothetical protein
MQHICTHIHSHPQCYIGTVHPYMHRLQSAYSPVIPNVEYVLGRVVAYPMLYLTVGRATVVFNCYCYYDCCYLGPLLDAAAAARMLGRGEGDGQIISRASSRSRSLGRSLYFLVPICCYS